MKNEIIWKKVKNFPNYEVSNTGEIRSYVAMGNTSKIQDVPRDVKKYKQNGYWIIAIGRKKILVHRIVAEAFIPNPEKFTIVAHLDGTRDNNNVSNLLWCTQKENMAHKKIHGTDVCRGRTVPGAPVKSIVRSVRMREEDLEWILDKGTLQQFFDAAIKSLEEKEGLKMEDFIKFRSGKKVDK